MRFLKSGFFHQTTPPGPTREVLEPFKFLVNFHRVMNILKRLPGIQDTGSHQKNLFLKFYKSFTKCIFIVNERFTMIFDRLLL